MRCWWRPTGRLSLSADGVVVLDVPVEIVAGVSAAQGSAARTVAARARYPRAYRAWSHEEDALLRELWAAGARREELVRRLERKPNAIQLRLANLGLVNDEQLALEHEAA